MVTGHPDWQTFAGRAVAGGRLITASFSGTVNAESASAFDIPVVPTGEEHAFIFVNLSCPDDSSINRVQITRISDANTLFENRFVAAVISEINSFKFVAGEQARVTITNNSLADLQFLGNLSWVVREV